MNTEHVVHLYKEQTIDTSVSRDTTQKHYAKKRSHTQKTTHCMLPFI